MVRRIVHPTGLNLFRFLEQFGVRIDLSDDEHRMAIHLTRSFVRKFQKMYQPEIIRAIGFDILHRLLKPMEINIDIIENVIGCYPVAAAEANARDNTSEPAVEPSDEDFMWDLIWKKECGSGENASCEDENMGAEEREMYKKMPTDKDMLELKSNWVKIGCRLNQDQATMVLNRVIQFLSDTFTIFSEYESTRKKCMDMFMEKVQEYMERLCVLNDVGTVESAVKTVESIGHKYLKEKQTERKDIVPAKGGIATAMLQLKLEERRIWEVRRQRNVGYENPLPWNRWC